MIWQEIVPLKLAALMSCLFLFQDNRPPGNVTSPGKVPIDLHISKLVIRRTEDGIFNIMGRFHITLDSNF